MRVLWAPSWREARRLLLGTRVHASGLRLDARALDPLRPGRPRLPPRGALLRPGGGGRGARRPGTGPPEPLVHHRRSARAPCRGGPRPDAPDLGAPRLGPPPP